MQEARPQFTNESGISDTVPVLQPHSYGTWPGEQAGCYGKDPDTHLWAAVYNSLLSFTLTMRFPTSLRTSSLIWLCHVNNTHSLKAPLAALRSWNRDPDSSVSSPLVPCSVAFTHNQSARTF